MKPKDEKIRQVEWDEYTQSVWLKENSVFTGLKSKDVRSSCCMAVLRKEAKAEADS